MYSKRSLSVSILRFLAVCALALVPVFLIYPNFSSFNSIKRLQESNTIKLPADKLLKSISLELNVQKFLLTAALSEADVRALGASAVNSLKISDMLDRIMLLVFSSEKKVQEIKNQYIEYNHFANNVIRKSIKKDKIPTGVEISLLATKSMKAKNSIEQMSLFDENEDLSEDGLIEMINTLSTLDSSLRQSHQVLLRSCVFDIIPHFNAKRVLSLALAIRQIEDDLSIQHGSEIRRTGPDIAFGSSAFKRLNEAMSHLVRNSIVHSVRDRHGGKIYISAKILTGEVLSIEMSDNGQGLDVCKIISIPPGSDVKEEGLVLAEKRFFDHGFTTESTISMTSSRGIGLQTSRQIIAALGGNITLKLKTKLYPNGRYPGKLIIQLKMTELSGVVLNLTQNETPSQGFAV